MAVSRVDNRKVLDKSIALLEVNTLIMKSWYSSVPLILGCIFFLAGAVFKISHWPHANEMLIAAITFEAAGLALLIMQVLSKSKKNGQKRNLT